MTRTRRFVIATVIAIAIGIGLSAAPASAAQYWSTGRIGTATVPWGNCIYKNAWNRLDASIAPPTIYARNNTYGSGNDAQWVRYRVFVVNDYTGQTVQSSGYSAFALAYDNRPAAFSGATEFINIPNNSKLDVRIEWWNSTSMVGALAFRVDHYRHYSGGMSPSGPIGGCTKW